VRRGSGLTNHSSHQDRCDVRKSQDIVTFSLQLPEEHVRELAARYQYQDDHDAEHVIGPAAKARGAFTKDEFIRLCRWKTPRSQSRARANSEEAIQEITRLALRIGDEELRVRSLTLLSGVEWPTASVILHFAHKDPYPILDYRALEALGVKQPSTSGWEWTCGRSTAPCGNIQKRRA